MRRTQLTQDRLQSRALMFAFYTRQYVIGIEIVNDLDIIQKKAVVS
jgi:hypothetical protein